jgi:hypothetical protein
LRCAPPKCRRRFRWWTGHSNAGHPDPKSRTRAPRGSTPAIVPGPAFRDACSATVCRRACVAARAGTAPGFALRCRQQVPTHAGHCRHTSPADRTHSVRTPLPRTGEREGFPVRSAATGMPERLSRPLPGPASRTHRRRSHIVPAPPRRGNHFPTSGGAGRTPPTGRGSAQPRRPRRCRTRCSAGHRGWRHPPPHWARGMTAHSVPGSASRWGTARNARERSAGSRDRPWLRPAPSPLCAFKAIKQMGFLGTICGLGPWETHHGATEARRRGCVNAYPLADGHGQCR